MPENPKFNSNLSLYLFSCKITHGHSCYIQVLRAFYSRVTATRVENKIPATSVSHGARHDYMQDGLHFPSVCYGKLIVVVFSKGFSAMPPSCLSCRQGKEHKMWDLKWGLSTDHGGQLGPICGFTTYKETRIQQRVI